MDFYIQSQNHTENLSHIILLIILRKILTKALFDRIWDRLTLENPKSQAAYQKSQWATKQVLNKVVRHTSMTYTFYSQMSEIFDKVNRKTLMSDPQQILGPPSQYHHKQNSSISHLSYCHLDSRKNSKLNFTRCLSIKGKLIYTKL